VSYAPIRDKLDTGRLVVLDGAIGTEILRREVTWADHQLLKRPEVVRAIHADYVAAGAEVLSTNTFQLTRRSFVQHFKDADHMRRIGAADLETRWADLLRAGVRLAQEARQEADQAEHVAVAGALTTLEWCFRPDLAPADDVAEAEYREVATVFAEAGCDLLLIETVNSVREAVAAARAARAVGLPFWIAFVHPSVSLRTLFVMFLKIGLSFGAGTGMSAVLQEELVRKRQAIGRGEFMALYGLARLVPSGSMTALAVAVGYRYQGVPGTLVVLLAMILPAFSVTVLLTVAYTSLAGSFALHVVNLTLMPAALALVVVSAFRLGREFFTPSLELVLAVGAGGGVLLFGLNPSLMLLAGGLIGALALRHATEDQR
jgi:chromate transport protein ChrA